MTSQTPVVGDVFAFPLEDGRFSACRVLRAGHGEDSVLAACCAWIGDQIPNVDSVNLRNVLHLTHHSHKGDPHIIWVSDPLPKDFVHLGVLELTPDEMSIECHSFSVWECITEQPLMQARWDADRDAVFAQEAIDRCRPGEILFGIAALDKPNGERVALIRRLNWKLLRASCAVVITIALHVVITVPSPWIAWWLSIATSLVICVIASIFVQHRYESRLPWHTTKVSGVEVNRVYRGPDWLTRMIGSELSWLVRASCISLNEKNVSAGVLAQMRSLSQVRMIILFGSNVDESGVRHLSKLKRLGALWLSKSNMTDRGLQSLRACHELTWLTLNGTKITDAGLVHLSGLRKIRSLDLGETSVSDLKPLQNWDCLRNLQLGQTSVTDSSLQYVSNLQLEHLDLNATPVTDAGLAFLSSLTSLERLELNKTVVSDAGLIHLRNLVNLKWIHLADTRVTLRGLFELESLPQLVGVVLGYHTNLDAIRRTFPQWKIVS